MGGDSRKKKKKMAGTVAKEKEMYMAGTPARKRKEWRGLPQEKNKCIWRGLPRMNDDMVGTPTRKGVANLISKHEEETNWRHIIKYTYKWIV